MLIMAKENRPRTPVAVMICWSMPTTIIVARSGSNRLTVSRESVRTSIFLGLTSQATRAAAVNSRGRPKMGVPKGQMR